MNLGYFSLSPTNRTNLYLNYAPGFAREKGAEKNIAGTEIAKADIPMYIGGKGSANRKESGDQSAS